MKLAAAALLLSVGLGTAVTSAQAAAPIYRCGADGTVYSQKPCAGGRLIDAADPRSDAQRAEAGRVAARERKLANDLERERRAQEATRATAAGINTAPAATQAAPQPRAGVKKRAAKPKPGSEDFVAIAPGKLAPSKKRGSK
jgi:hypothetical protein